MLSRKMLFRFGSNYPTYNSSFWEWLVVRRDFEKAITSEGYYIIEKFKILSEFRHWKKEIRSRHRGSWVKAEHDSRISSPYLGPVDTMSQTPDVLRENGFFIMNAGRSRSIVFDSRKFIAPYTSLARFEYSAHTLSAGTKPNQSAFVSIFRSQWNEASFIKALHFCGAFKELTKKLSGVDSYISGPSGVVPSKFPFWMRRNRRARTGETIGFVYQGMVDLDESIYPLSKRRIVILVEAKLQHFQDLGWHKLAFPSNRFIAQDGSSKFFYKTGSESRFASADGEDLQRSRSHFRENTSIIPVYCAADPIRRSAYIYVFRELKIHGNLACEGRCDRGLLLNEPKSLIPEYVYNIDLSWIFGRFR